MAGISLETNKKDGVISFSGKTGDNDILAVSCALLDKDKNEIELISVAVNDNAFSGKFLSSEGVEIECDDYDSESDDGKVAQIIATETKEGTDKTGNKNDAEEGATGDGKNGNEKVETGKKGENAGNKGNKTETEAETEGTAGTGDTGFFTAENSFAVGSFGAFLIAVVLGAIFAFRFKKQSKR